MSVTIANTVRNAMVDAFVDLIDAGSGPGTLEIGTAAMASTLATLTFGDPAYAAAASGSASLNSAITADTNTGAGTAAAFRIKDSNGTLLASGTVGTSGADIIFSNVTFTSGGICNVSSLTVTQPAS